jgi:glycosyltransferase involved in cell wall biosynthesis
MPEKVPISVAVITKNEEQRLGPCLLSVSFADDIVVLDSGSFDRTLDVAKEHGARTFTEKWKGYGPQKQRALDLCKHDMVFMIDADERLMPDGVEIIQSLIAEGNLAPAYSVKRKSYIGTRWIKGCDWWPDRVTRLVDRKRCHMVGNIHERVEVDGNTKHLEAVLEHYSFKNYGDLIKKMDLYSDYTSDELIKKGRAVGPLSPVTHGAFMFFKSFIIKKGFIDGFDGFVISLMNAGGAFFKYAKAIEKFRQK